MSRSEYTSIPYANVFLGDILIPDGGFDCLEAGVPVEVKLDAMGLYVECTKNRYYLGGQRITTATGTYLVGFKRA